MTTETIKLAAAIRRRLPSVARELAVDQVRQASLATSTKTVASPSIWQDDKTRFLAEGQRYWAYLAEIDKWQGRLKNNARNHQKAVLDEEEDLMVSIRKPDKDAKIYTEGDVIDIAQDVLINPVMICVKSLFRDLTIRKRREKNSKHGRTDIVWEVHQEGTDANDAENWIECAIFEFKNTNIIKPEHFAEARLGRRDKVGATLTREEMEYQAKKSPNRTLMKYNAVILSKQARKYAARTPYVALFDWDTMALFDFSDTNHQSEEPICPRLSLFSERDVDDNKAGKDNGQTHCMYLFGFLAHAITERMGYDMKNPI